MASYERNLFAMDESSEDRTKEKSPNALRTISEASEMLDIPQHVLRFWETKFTQIKPLKRNGGRRFYRPQDLDVLQQIKHLLYAQGYTIKGAQKAIAEFVARGPVKDQGPWEAAFPPANVNDNAPTADSEVLLSERDVLAEIADILNEPEPQAYAAATSALEQTQLRAVRDELVATRDALARHLVGKAA